MTVAPAPAIAIDIAVWAAIQVTAGFVVHRLPPHRVDRDTWLFRERAWERRGRIYIRVFRVRRWKRWLPEAGAVFSGGFDKRHLATRDPAYLRAYAGETRRAELGHWLAIVPFPVFFLWNPRLVAWCMPVYTLAVNGPCIVSQRFNRIRLRRVLAASQRDHGRPPRPAPEAGEGHRG